MFKGIEKKRFYTMERIWFSDCEKSKADIVRYSRISHPMKGSFVHCKSSETVVSDLTLSMDVILSHCTKTVKYEYNKCAKEDVAVTFHSAGDLQNTPQIVDEFEKAYLDFARDLGIEEVVRAYQRSKIDNFISCGTIMLSKAEADGVTVYHVYACGNEEACLIYSVSNFRNDPSKKNLAGRMNKLLHIRDMEYFKDKGGKLYDWGNIRSSQSPNGIDKFKMSFGGEVRTVYNVFVGNTLLGKILVLLYKIIGR